MSDFLEDKPWIFHTMNMTEDFILNISEYSATSQFTFLGPGISSELEIVNWKYEVSQLLIHCFTPNSLDNYGAYSIPRKTVNWEEYFEIYGLEGLKK